jgi:hypothetical protein
MSGGVLLVDSNGILATHRYSNEDNHDTSIIARHHAHQYDMASS